MAGTAFLRRGFSLCFYVLLRAQGKAGRVLLHGEVAYARRRCKDGLERLFTIVLAGVEKYLLRISSADDPRNGRFLHLLYRRVVYSLPKTVFVRGGWLFCTDAGKSVSSCVLEVVLVLFALELPRCGMAAQPSGCRRVGDRCIPCALPWLGVRLSGSV